jgi:glucose-fructose oxidoreductase
MSRAPGSRSIRKETGKVLSAPVRFAVIGLGYISQIAVLPSFEHAKRSCRLTALISGDEVKRKRLSKRYGAHHVWDYEHFDEALESDTFDAVYIALPNHLHREYAVRAARAGKHVLVEKPMALSARDCDAMIRAADEHDVRLMVAYRLHLDPVSLRAIEIARSGRIGEPQSFVSSFGMTVRPGNIRTREDKGGGALWDIGIYCINAARHLFAAEPVEAFAWTSHNRHARFYGVESAAIASLRFPGGQLATFWNGLASADIGRYTLVGSKGHLSMEHAYEYHEPRDVALTVGGRVQRRRYSMHDQFAAEMTYFSRCVQDGTDPVPSGMEGRADVAVIEALYASARSGKAEKVRETRITRRPKPGMGINRPPVRNKPELVHANAPH